MPKIKHSYPLYKFFIDQRLRLKSRAKIIKLWTVQ